ncbi:MAG: hypothetical protein VX509_05210 [Verrucomicrobiota bacterium]|nr:hypothetical protein [Verrucomicrobiota bacterium]
MRRTAQGALVVHRFAGRGQAAVRDALVGPGDLPVITDYRDVLIPILRRHAPDADMARIFPGHEAKPLGQMLEAV